MNDTLVHQSMDSRCQRVLQVAKQLYQTNPDWVTFFREVLGIEGAARKVFPNQSDYVAFEKSECYVDIQQMVTALRQRKIPGGGHNEPTRVITVRLPESLHEALKAEASDHKTSMNKLCISKLLQALVEEEQMSMLKRAQAAPPQPAVASTAPAAAPVAANRPGMTAPTVSSEGSIGRYSNL